MNEPQQPPPRAQILITFHANGAVQVQGSIGDKVLAYGLLECARDAIKDASDQQARSPIIGALPVDPFLNRKRD